MGSLLPTAVSAVGEYGCLPVHANSVKKLLDARELVRIVSGRVHVMLFGYDHVSKIWTNTLGIPYILVSDNSPGKATAREISIDGKMVTVQEVSIQSEWDVVE